MPGNCRQLCRGNAVTACSGYARQTTPELSRLMETASGHVDLAVWPERVRWGGFDLWAGNLLRSLLPFFSRTSSHINCVIGHFDLDRGALSSQALIVDTTNTRALGWAEADFATRPRASPASSVTCFGSAIAGTGVGWIADRWGWGGVFATMVACCLLTMVFSALTLGHKATCEGRTKPS